MRTHRSQKAVRLPLMSLFSALLAADAALGASGSAAGLRWSVPAGWTEQRARPMRVATYAIPGSQGAEAGECAVFYFGKGQGGSVEENIARWSQQFDGSPKPRRTRKTIQGLRVHLADISGTYLSAGGPMMPSQEKKPNFRLLGAIVEAPEGLIFFKFTGPAATIAKAQPDFDKLIDSLTKAETTRL